MTETSTALIGAVIGGEDRFFASKVEELVIARIDRSYSYPLAALQDDFVAELIELGYVFVYAIRGADFRMPRLIELKVWIGNSDPPAESPWHAVQSTVSVRFPTSGLTSERAAAMVTALISAKV